MATLWCLPEEEQVDPLMQTAHPPAPCRVIEITAQVRAKDERDRAERERLRFSGMSWRRPESMPEVVEPPVPTNYQFPAGRANGKRPSVKRKA